MADHTRLPQLDSPQQAAQWLAARVRGRLRTDSRSLQPGDGFIAWPGLAQDGRQFVPAALSAGAAACLVEAEGVHAHLQAFDLAGPAAQDRVALLRGLKAAAGELADHYFAQPSAVLDVVATTGTNGKTSTAWWTAQALTRLGRRCGVIGTLGVGEPPSGTGNGDGTHTVASVQSTGLTTPDPITLHSTFRGFVDLGFTACTLEASSIGIQQERLAQARIDVAMFTNFTRDHLDYHGSMDAYWAAKRRLFDWPGLRAAVVNIDDERGAMLADELRARRGLDLWTVSLLSPARLQALSVQHNAGGLSFTLAEGAQHVPVHSALVGSFNASNLLVVLGGLRALRVPLVDAARVCAALTPVPGRMQRVTCNGGSGGIGGSAEPAVVVDYAHTPDALQQVLRALRPLAQARGGRLWCVFGCGGNRDASKRPLMGAIAARDADHVVLTSDNPRHENPSLILAQILTGVTGHDDIDVIEDRREAIRSTLLEAAPADVVLLAGKGHEDYQETAGQRRPFSDIEQARAALAERATLAAATACGVVRC